VRVSWRTRILLGLLILLVIALAVAVVHGGRDAPATVPKAAATTVTGPAAGAVPLTTVLPDPVGAAQVPIDGATAAETQVARRELSLLGPNPGITRLTFDDRAQHGRRRLLITQPTDDRRRQWLAELFARNVVALLAQAGERIDWYEFAGRSGTVVREPAPTTGGGTLLSAVVRTRDALSRARADADVTTYPIGGVAVTWRVGDREMLGAPPAAWLETAGIEFGTSPSYYAEVVAPNGSPIFYAGEGVGTCAACGAISPTPIPGTPTAGEALRRTHLVIDAVGTGPTPGRVEIACGKLATDGDIAALCRDLDLDRYALLQPLIDASTCVGGGGSPNVAVSGIFAGRLIQRTYAECEGGLALRWIALLQRHHRLPQGFR
jgi:hypothetical protein